MAPFNKGKAADVLFKANVAGLPKTRASLRPVTSLLASGPSWSLAYAIADVIPNDAGDKLAAELVAIGGRVVNAPFAMAVLLVSVLHAATSAARGGRDASSAGRAAGSGSAHTRRAVTPDPAVTQMNKLFYFIKQRMADVIGHGCAKILEYRVCVAVREALEVATGSKCFALERFEQLFQLVPQLQSQAAVDAVQSYAAGIINFALGRSEAVIAELKEKKLLQPGTTIPDGLFSSVIATDKAAEWFKSILYFNMDLVRLLARYGGGAHVAAETANELLRCFDRGELDSTAYIEDKASKRAVLKHLLRIEERVFHVVVDNTDAIRGMVADIKGALTPPGASFSSTLRMSQLSLDNRAFTNLLTSGTAQSEDLRDQIAVELLEAWGQHSMQGVPRIDLGAAALEEEELAPLGESNHIVMRGSYGGASSSSGGGGGGGGRRRAVAIKLFPVEGDNAALEIAAAVSEAASHCWAYSRPSARDLLPACLSITVIRRRGQPRHEMAVVMELAPGKPLDVVLDEMAADGSSDFAHKVVADELIWAFNKLTQTVGIIHRDLKPPNIIYDPSKPAFSRVNFIDCDRMIPVNAADPQDISGTPGWMAPEMEARYSGDKEDPATWSPFSPLVADQTSFVRTIMYVLGRGMEPDEWLDRRPSPDGRFTGYSLESSRWSFNMWRAAAARNVCADVINNVLEKLMSNWQLKVQEQRPKSLELPGGP